MNFNILSPLKRLKVRSDSSPKDNYTQNLEANLVIFRCPIMSHVQAACKIGNS